MKRVLILIFIAGIFISCSTKLPNSPLISKSITDYQKMSRDSSIEEFAPKESFKAQNLYKMLLKEKNLKSANHLAYLLDKEIKIAKNNAKIAKLKRDTLLLENKIVKEELKRKTEELNRLKAQQDALLHSEKIVNQLHPQMTKRGIRFIFGDELFEKNGSRLLLGAIVSIDKLVDFLKDHPNRKVLIEGFSDNSGSSSYNLDFSLRRAHSVANMLINQGISKERIIVNGYGERKNIAANDTKEGRIKNRRVEVTILNSNRN
jgi:outer membrane protein OmpA-like peptidoglycan-associated protein